MAPAPAFRQVGQLSSLRELLLPGNQLRALPPLAHLSRLTELDLSSNLLEEIPAELADLRALTHLDLARNRIAALPAWPLLPALLATFGPAPCGCSCTCSCSSSPVFLVTMRRHRVRGAVSLEHEDSITCQL